ncbi:MAG: hypothetical protein FWE88_03460 [Phycisphaerae bacterium]|nr:hypothetical protein [Phycisphaerae bacterium]
MVVRNRRDKRDEHAGANTNANNSSDGLEPCRQSLDARDVKKALKAFIAACGKTAAVATVAVAISSANVSCRSHPGTPGPRQVTTQPADEDGTEMMRTGGVVAVPRIITQPAGNGDTETVDPPGGIGAAMITLEGESPAVQITTQPAKEGDIEATEEEEEEGELGTEIMELEGDILGVRIIVKPAATEA